jgi:hypothetical protein
MSLVLLGGLKRNSDSLRRLKLRREAPLVVWENYDTMYEIGESELLYYLNVIRKGRCKVFFSTTIEPFLRIRERCKNEEAYHEEDLSDSYSSTQEEDYYSSDGFEHQEREFEMD